MAKPLQKPRENRSAATKDSAFHSYDITPHSAATAVLLLRSREPEILCQTLRAMTKFSGQEMENRLLLLELDAVDAVLPHAEHSELNVRRFALKALAQLAQLPCGPELVLRHRDSVRNIARMIVKVEDVYILEFASLLLAELTREPEGCSQLVAADVLASLFHRMRSSLDPDVQKNCLQVLSNLLSDPACAGEVTRSAQFSWAALLVLMQSKFCAIQSAAINTVHQLLLRARDEAVQRTFRASSGLLDLLDILESYEFRDVHAHVLLVLRDYVSAEASAAHAHQAGGVLRLLRYLDTALPAMKPPCLAALTRMSYTASGRQALLETGVDLEFCRQLQGAGAELAADAALGVANMTRLLPSAVRMCDTDVVETLCAILSDESAAWFDVRLNALRALTELCRVIPPAARRLVEPRTFASLRGINRKPKDSPIEAQRLAVQCYINLQNYDDSRRAMTDAEFIRELLDVLERPDISLRILSCEALCGLMSEAGCQQMFSACGGEAAVARLLRAPHVALRTALCRLLAASVTRASAPHYLADGTLHYMVSDRAAWYSCPAWEAAIEAIFRQHAAARLAYTGRLEINHLTKDGFYVTKRLPVRFPALDTLLAEHCSPCSAIYVASLAPPDRDSSSLSTASESSTSRQSGSKLRTRSAVGMGAASRSPQPRRNSRGDADAAPPAPPAPRAPDDPHLRDYLLRLRMWLGDTSKSEHFVELGQHELEIRSRARNNEVSSCTRQRAQLLAEFVAEQTCGATEQRDCSLRAVDLHLNDLKVALETNVIPLGYVRVGGALERAVLYKVLADRVGVPCALTRATAARAWCEVAVPEPDPDEPPESEQHYPAALLRANYAVDLTDQPGRLLALGSPAARRLTGEPDAAAPPRRYLTPTS